MGLNWFEIIGPVGFIFQKCHKGSETQRVKTSAVLMILLLGCQTRRDLTITDLKFGDFEKPYRAKNQVDTTYLISKNSYVKWRYGELLLRADFFNWKLMDVGFVAYDSLGRTISNKSMRWEDYQYFYDSKGILDSIVHRDWDVRPIYGSTYEFYPDSSVLHQKWTQRGRLHHISRFKFNESGNVIEEYNDNNQNRSRITQIFYEYENDEMKGRNEKIFENGQLDCETTTQLYYSKNLQLDSTVSMVNSKEDGVYKMVTYYDSSGLKQRTILMDTITILYRHVKRKKRLQ